jgi:hypothetical protein
MYERGECMVHKQLLGVTSYPFPRSKDTVRVIHFAASVHSSLGSALRGHSKCRRRGELPQAPVLLTTASLLWQHCAMLPMLPRARSRLTCRWERKLGVAKQSGMSCLLPRWALRERTTSCRALEVLYHRADPARLTYRY